MCVDPREVMRVVPVFLTDRYGVDFRFATPVQSVSAPELDTADGTTWHAEQIIVASGSDFASLFPAVFATSELRICKLQMMRTAAQPDGWRIGPHLASGLTLRHYANFATCQSLERLKQRIASEAPELDRYGIHVMAAQNGGGEVILGDSHEYGAVIEPFCRAEIEELMLRELRKVVRLQDWTIADRWYGVYAKHATLPYFEHSPQPGVRIVTGLGGAGMTMSFGVASQ
jgi:FAD dependent oxidoreductase TIGR03364